MYNIVKIILIVGSIICIIYFHKLESKYKNNKKEIEKDVIKYFEERNATNLENGINAKELPKDIAENPYLLYMIKYKTLKMGKGKYYLNK